MRYQLLAEVRSGASGSARPPAPRRVVAAIDAGHRLDPEEASRITRRLEAALRSVFARHGLVLSAPELVRAPTSGGPA